MFYKRVSQIFDILLRFFCSVDFLKKVVLTPRHTLNNQSASQDMQHFSTNENLTLSRRNDSESILDY